MIQRIPPTAVKHLISPAECLETLEYLSELTDRTIAKHLAFLLGISRAHYNKVLKHLRLCADGDEVSCRAYTSRSKIMRIIYLLSLTDQYTRFHLLRDAHKHAQNDKSGGRNEFSKLTFRPNTHIQIDTIINKEIKSPSSELITPTEALLFIHHLKTKIHNVPDVQDFHIAFLLGVSSKHFNLVKTALKEAVNEKPSALLSYSSRTQIMRIIYLLKIAHPVTQECLLIDAKRYAKKERNACLNTEGNSAFNLLQINT